VKDARCSMGGRRLLLMATTALAMVACTASGEEPPPRFPDGDDVPAIYVAAVEQRCAPCADAAVYLVDEYLAMEGGGDPLPGDVEEALIEGFGDVRLTSLFGVAALEGQGAITPPHGVLVSVGPIVELGPGVVGIDVATTVDGWSAHTVPFAWEGDEWVLTTPEESGVTVTSAVG
jgi:hypothetical protein